MNHPTCLFFLLVIILNLSRNLATAFDTITPTQPLTPNHTLVSSGSIYELGFFSPDNSSDKLYIGIWYKRIPTRTIVWVANRESPVTNSTAVLKITETGNLALTDESGAAIWQTNETTGSTNTLAQLLDTGNMVLRPEDDVDPESYIWQSFHYPADTLLPDMKLGLDKKTGTNRFISSWRLKDDPSPGDFAFKMNADGFPSFFLWRKQTEQYRSGPWNGLRFSGVPEMGPSYNITFSFVMDSDEVSYSFELSDKLMYSRLLVNSLGILQRFVWIETSQSWNLFWYAPADQCDIFRECGPYGVCDTNNSPVCTCMKGFEPKNKQAWALRDGSQGCVRTTELNCKDDGFLSLKNIKLPESSRATINETMGLGDCQMACLRDCPCTAYANMDIRKGGSGCVMWTGELVDMRQYATGAGGQEMFVRVSADVLDAGSVRSGTSSGKTGKIFTGVGIAVAGIVLLALILFIARKKKKMQRARRENISYRAPQERSQDYILNDGGVVSTRDYSSEYRTDEFELPLFDFATMLMATENFSNDNKLGQGGFGIVYKGMLGECQQIAVKRLSKTSVQGIDEFKNEVRLIARLQHRNLVRLLGCCVEMEEKILIYEYMENKSLDSILFKKERQSMLDWQTRFNIICGIARGLLYLHQDSRFRIIHRDLKASNILLDKDMTPKISDFGMARIFGGDQTEANTKKVVGTYGYMSPEYAMDGLFSIKSDVFSFGVLVVEIVTGKKNRGFYNENLQLNLLGQAWRLWREGKGLELIDPSAGDTFSSCEVLRCIQVGLLCVQERAEDRPNMSSVVLMLGSETASMPQPKNPDFRAGRHSEETETLSCGIDESCTVNRLTVTILDGR